MSTNFFKVTTAPQQTTTSATYVVLTGTTLTFTPANVSEIWMIFASGTINSSNGAQITVEIGLFINGTQKDIGGHSLTTNVTGGPGFMFFDRITGTTALQTINLRLRSNNGSTSGASQLSVIAARVPDGSDFQYIEDLAQVQTTGTNVVIQNLTFTPSAAGEYIFLGSAKIRSVPGGTGTGLTVGFREATNAAAIHPLFQRHTNPSDCWNPATYIWRETLPASSVTASTIFSTNSGTGSQHIYRKLMAFRVDAWGSIDFTYDSTNTLAAVSKVLKNSLTATFPGFTSDYLSIQIAKIDLNGIGSTFRLFGYLEPFSSLNVQNSQHCPSVNTSYEVAIGLVDARTINSGLNTLLFQNHFGGTGATANCAESTILVLRYFGVDDVPSGYHVII